VVVSGPGLSEGDKEVLLEGQDGPDENDTRGLLLKWLSLPGTYRVYWRRDDGGYQSPVEEYTFTEGDLPLPDEDE